MQTIPHTIALLTLVLEFSSAQVLINKEWEQTHGVPSSDFNYQTSVKDYQNNIIIIGNTYHPVDKENFYLLKYASNGNLLWSVDMDGITAGTKDFGIDVITDSKGDIYCTGVSYDTSNNSKIYTAKFSKDGIVRWRRGYMDSTYNMGLNAPADLLVIGNKLYVAGTTQKSLLNHDAIILAYDTSNGNFAWKATRDVGSSLDGFVGLTSVTGFGTQVKGYGFTGSSFTNWKYLTSAYNASTGTATSWDTTSSSTVGFSSPVDLIKDKKDNMYLIGFIAKAAGWDYDIRIVKFDSAFTKIWEQDFTWTNSDDRPTAIRFANNSETEIYISGKSKQVIGGSAQSAVLLKLNAANGNKIWEYKLDGAESSFEKIVENPANSKVYAVGTIIENGKKHYLTQSFDSIGHLLWSRSFLKGTESEGKTVLLQDDGGITVSGRTFESGTWNYTTLKYREFEPSSEIYKSSNEDTMYLKGQIIVSFRPEFVDTAFVNNKDKHFDALPNVIPDSIVTLLNSASDIAFNKLKVWKIYPDFTTDMTESISRLGRTVPIPTFWSQFVLQLPVDVSVPSICSLLNSYPYKFYIEFTEPNYLVKLLSAPNDSLYLTDDFSGLYPTASFPNANINIEPAWELTTGDTSIRVGVFDSGVNFSHEDFQNTSQPATKVRGYDFVYMTPIGASFTKDSYGHGTAVAAIIGANRNNGKGGAGIAGGDFQIGNEGVRLFNYRVGIKDLISLVTIGNAIANSTTNNSLLGNNPLHVMNLSWGSIIPYFSIQKGVLNAFNNDVVVVSGTGNTTTPGFACNNIIYPAASKDEWVLATGANDSTGNRVFLSHCGPTLDFIAPGVENLYTSPSILSDSTYTDSLVVNPVRPLWGTSFATPHVTGLAALMLSYVNTHPQKPNNLSPEDVEQLIQLYATDVNTAGRDLETGYGRIDAGRTLWNIKLPEREVKHYDFSSRVAPYEVPTMTPVDTILREVYFTSDFMGEGEYEGLAHCYRYKVWRPATHNIGNRNLLKSWKRIVTSTLLPILDDTIADPNINYFPNEYDIFIDTITKTSAAMYGYTYKVFVQSLVTGLVDTIWYPVGPSDTVTFSYTLLISDTGYTSIKSTEDDLSIEVYPNPANSTLNLTLHGIIDETEISIFDIAGRKTKEPFLTSIQTNCIDISSLSSGFYILQVKHRKKSSSVRFIKQ
jgi:subtilisin family serine protease